MKSEGGKRKEQIMYVYEFTFKASLGLSVQHHMHRNIVTLLSLILHDDARDAHLVSSLSKLILFSPEKVYTQIYE